MIYSAPIRMFSLSENEMELIERKSTVGSLTAVAHHLKWAEYSSQILYLDYIRRILGLHIRSRYGHGGPAEGDAYYRCVCKS